MGIWILIIFSASVLLTIIYTFLYGISPMPSSGIARKAILKVIPENQKGNIYELGSGWGTLALPIAKQCPKAMVKGFEISPIPWIVSKILQLFCGYPNLNFYRKDFFHVSLDDASIVVCYLYPEAMKQLKNKLEKELKPGSVVISNTFAIPGWTPEHVHTLDDLYHTKIYVYRR